MRLMLVEDDRRIAADVEGGESAGVAGTPTFFINDRRYAGAYDLDSLERALQDGLRELELMPGPLRPT